MQKLKVFQSLWAMELRHPGLDERTDEENLRMIAEAGYAGICIDPSRDEIPRFRKLEPLIREFDLECMVNAFPFALDDMRALYGLAVELDAVLVNIISGVMPIRPQDAVPVVRQWIAEAGEVGLPVLFETHRDSLLNDLYFALQLIELVPEMRLCADLSHFVVDREMREPVNARDQAWIDTILERSDCFQGRVANREQVQIQIDFPQHQEWVRIFRQWWRSGMQRWRQRNDDNAELVFLCELGPPPYAITDARQEELSDRWREALKIKAWAEAIWQDISDQETQRMQRVQEIRDE
jgi:hypothetical protein